MQDLAGAMSDLSEEYLQSGWHTMCEFYFWRCITEDTGSLTAEHKALLRELSAACGGWVIWHEHDDPMENGETWVPLAEWERRYAEHQSA